MTVNELIRQLREYQKDGAGECGVTVHPYEEKSNCLAGWTIRCVSPHGVHNGKFLNIRVYTNPKEIKK